MLTAESIVVFVESASTNWGGSVRLGQQAVNLGD